MVIVVMIGRETEQAGVRIFILILILCFIPVRNGMKRVDKSKTERHVLSCPMNRVMMSRSGSPGDSEPLHAPFQ